jgi:TonB family protein
MRNHRIAVLSVSIAMGAGLPAFSDTKPPSPIVQVCLDSAGQIETAEIVETSTYPDIDAAALKVARAARFAPGPGKKDGKPSCIRFRVKFVLKDGVPVPEGS